MRVLFLGMPKYYLLLLILLLLHTLPGCGSVDPDNPPNDVLDGPIPGLTMEQQRVHAAGDAAFNDEVFTPTSGLGPLFVASSCGACHPADGRGHPSTVLIRFGQSMPGANPWMGKGGPQLQQHAIPGFQPELLPAGVASARFLAPIVTGLGYLDAVTDHEILSWADEFDINGDGISGRPQRIPPPPYAMLRANADVDATGNVIGRFGRKATSYDLLQQTAVAYNQDIGITSALEPVDPHSQLPHDPEVSLQTINSVVFYLQTLRIPPRRNANAPEVLRGERVFTSIGCAACHRPTMTTGTSAIPQLSHVSFSPYTDLLLHDMGPELDDGYTEGNAERSEWRTTPLWGYGLSRKFQGGGLFLLHDGRARSLREAIEYHGGEGAAARARFRALPAHEQQDLEAFLESL